MKKYRYFAMTAVAICALTAAAPAARAEGASTSMMENFMESIQQGMNEIQGWFTPVQDEAIGMGGQGDVAENTAIEVPPQLIEPAAGDASAIDMLNDAAEESMGVMDGEGIEGLGEGIDQGAMIQQTPTMERIEAQAMNNDGGLISVETVGENTQEAAMETIEETAEATPEMVEETVKEAVATETTTPTIEETIEETAKVVTEEIEETVEEIAEGATEAVEDTVADVAEEGTEEAAETTA